MASYAFKQMVNVNLVGAGVVLSTNLFTVPAGHIYVIKKAHFRITRTGAGAHTISFNRSDTAGINFRLVTDLFITPAAASSNFVNLTPAVPALQTNPLTNEGATTQGATIENLICEAGTILRINSAANFLVTDSVQVAVDGIDYTL